MTREQLWDIIGDIDDRFIAEAARYNPKQRSRSPERIGIMSKKRIITFALAAVLILALGAAAYATGFFGLKDLQTGSGANTSVIVAGWSDSPEEQAAKDWTEFKLHARHNLPDIGISFSNTDLVSQVGAFSPEAKEKLNLILEKYGLQLPEEVLLIHGVEGLYEVCGHRGCLPEIADTNDGYPVGGKYFRGGSFTLADAAKLGEKTVRFDMTRSVKGYFTGVVGYSLDVDNMEEWTYTTSSSVKTILNLGPARAAAIIPLENSFVYIHFRSGSETGYDSQFDLLTKSDLEAFVESIDFYVLDSFS